MSKIKMPWLSVRAQANSESYEISVRGAIGNQWDMDEYALTNTEQEVLNELEKIPAGKKINLRVNSEGGNVAYALGIYNAFKRRAADITCYNEGIACSSASILMLAGSKCICPSSSLMMVHCASTISEGNAADMEKTTEMLNAYDKTIANIYAAKTGDTPEKMLELMKNETWMNGDEARKAKFADESNEDGEPSFNDIDGRIAATFKRIPNNLRRHIVAAQLNNGGNKPASNQPTNQNKPMKKLIKALVDAKLIASASEDDDAVSAEFVKNFGVITATADSSKTTIQKHVEAQNTRVTNRVQAAIDSKKVLASRKDSLIEIGVRDESALDFLDDIKPVTAQAAPAQRGAKPAPVDNEGEGGVNGQITALVEANKTASPEERAENCKKIRKLRYGSENLFAEAQKN